MAVSALPEAEQAIAHYSVDGQDLEGVWVSHGGTPMSYYPAGEDSAEHAYAEARILGADWQGLVEELPNTVPYMAFFTAVERKPNESPEDLHGRLNRTR